MKQFVTLIASVALVVTPALAQRTLTDIAHSIKPGGYIINQYTTTDADDGAKTDQGFGIRLVRLYVNGSIFDDFKYRLQIQSNGMPGTNSGSRIVDAYGEWTRYKGFQIRAGQMKRAFTFENPMNPWDIGFGAYSQVITKLTGFSDRVGEHASNGRDAGILFQGDLFPIQSRRFLHYQIGIYNGQGTNQRDKNHKRDIIGGLWINPIKGLNVGAFGWEGNYVNGDNTYARHRLAYGFKYEGDLQFRGEYISSVGECPAAQGLTNKADGWYIMAGVPVGNHLRAQAKWDVYRQDKSHATQQTKWSIALDWWFAKNLKLQLNYDFNDLENGVIGATDHHYNTADLQLYIRF